MCSSWYRLLHLQQTLEHQPTASGSWLIICAKPHFTKIKRNHTPFHQKYNHWRTTASCCGTLIASAGLLPPSTQRTREASDAICLQGDATAWANITLNARIIKNYHAQLLLNVGMLGKGRKLMLQVLLRADKCLWC